MTRLHWIRVVVDNFYSGARAKSTGRQLLSEVYFMLYKQIRTNPPTCPLYVEIKLSDAGLRWFTNQAEEVQDFLRDGIARFASIHLTQIKTKSVPVQVRVSDTPGRAAHVKLICAEERARTMIDRAADTNSIEDLLESPQSEPDEDDYIF